MMTQFPLGESEFDSWKGCGVGSFVMFESQTEYVMPGFEELRNLPEPPSGLDFEASLREIGIDPVTGIARQVTTTTTRLLEVGPDALTLETEITSNIQKTSRTHRLQRVVHADPPPETETRSVVSDSPDCHAEVIKIPWASLKPTVSPKESQESLSIAGQEIFCRVTEYTANMKFSLNGTPLDKGWWIKCWSSNKIPGGMAKEECRMGASNGRFGLERMIVLSFEKK